MPAALSRYVVPLEPDTSFAHKEVNRAFVAGTKNIKLETDVFAEGVVIDPSSGLPTFTITAQGRRLPSRPSPRRRSPSPSKDSFRSKDSATRASRDSRARSSRDGRDSRNSRDSAGSSSTRSSPRRSSPRRRSDSSDGKAVLLDGYLSAGYGKVRQVVGSECGSSSHEPRARAAGFCLSLNCF